MLPKDICFIAIDFPGHGKSCHRWPGMPYTIFEYVADVKKIVSQLGWNKFSIIGHSMGANVASLYAGTFPSEVKQLILIDYSDSTVYCADKPALTLARYATIMTKWSTVFPRVYQSLEAAAEKREVQNLGTTLHKEDAMLLTERGTKPIEEGIIFSHSPLVRENVVPLIAPQWAVKAILSKIQCAVLVLEATDTVHKYTQVREANLERLKVICENAKYKSWKRIKGGHQIHLENHVVVAEEIEQFLAIKSLSIVQSKL